MSIRSFCHRFTFLLLLPLFAAGCGEEHAIASPAPAQAPLALTADSVVGGGGLNIAVYEAGNASGPPIVFIHGFTGSHLSWQQQFSRSLASDFRLITYDLRGHGASDKPLDAAQYTNAALWAEDLNAVIQSKNLDRPVLVGWSYGGYVIADYVRRFTDSRIGGLVFVGAVTKQGTAEAASLLSDEVLALFPEVLAPEVGKSIDGTRKITHMFAHPDLRGEPWEVSFGSAMMVPPLVRQGMFSRMLDNDDVLRGIRVPTLVIQGRQDALVRMTAASHITRTIPGAELLVYESIGHAPFVEAPDKFNGDLTKFVRTKRGM